MSQTWIIGAITGRALYQGTLDFAQAVAAAQGTAP
jgi:phosphoribosylformimino-5-aminoimidazole carboxamide ribonucleotide (ProFAR) isomerase